jgi:hypothetical protein
VELGEQERIDFIGRKPRMSYPAKARFSEFIGRVNAIQAEYSAFRRGENCWFVDGGHPAIIAAFRRDSDSQTQGFLVVCNFDTTNPQHIVIELGPLLRKAGPIASLELLSSKTELFPNTKLELKLPPCGVQVLKF